MGHSRWILALLCCLQVVESGAKNIEVAIMRRDKPMSFVDDETLKALCQQVRRASVCRFRHRLGLLLPPYPGPRAFSAHPLRCDTVPPFCGRRRASRLVLDPAPVISPSCPLMACLSCRFS